MYFFNLLLNQLMKQSLENDKSLHVRELKEKIGDHEVNVQLYFKNDGSLYYIDSTSMYVPDDRQKELNQLLLEKQAAIEKEDFLRAAELRDLIEGKKKELQKV